MLGRTPSPTKPDCYERSRSQRSAPAACRSRLPRGEYWAAHPHSLCRIPLASSTSQPWQTWTITRERTSRRARRTASLHYAARPQRGSAVANGRFPKERLSYDPAADAYCGPGGQLLDTRYRSITRGHVSIQYSTLPPVPPVPPGRSGHGVPAVAGGASTVGRTRRYSSAWRRGSQAGPAFLTSVGRRSSIRSARSSSG